MTRVAFTPACMDAAELALWTAANRRATGGGVRRFRDDAPTPCHDCTLGYAADMRALGRCNGTPGGVEEDEMDMTTAIAEAAQIIGRRRVTTVAPCEGCVHARVCRLRPADSLEVSVTLPALADELTVTLTATVECSEYAKAKGAKTAPAGKAARVISPEGRERMRQSGLAAADRRKAAREEVA